MRILVIKTSSFGDIVQLFPALGMLYRKYPDATLDFVTNPEFVPLLEYSPFPINKTIIFERKKLGKISSFLPQLIRLIREIRKEKYDFAVDFQGLFRNAFIAGISRADVKAGFAAPREKLSGIFYNRPIKTDSIRAVEKYGELASKLFSLSDTLKPEFAPAKPLNLAKLPPLPAHYAVLLPGSRWKSKRFPPELFREVMNILHQKFPELKFFATGSADEKDIAGAISSEIINLAGKTSMGELIELLRRADLVVGNDSGPLHAAAALGVPVFGFYGASSTDRTAPWGENTQVFCTGEKCCGCRKRICPDGSYRCRKLNAESIAGSIIKTLEKRV